MGIQNGPSIDIPITSLQANAMVVDHVKCTLKIFANDTQSAQGDQKGSKKIKITTNTLHDRFHRSDGVLATVQAHNLWRDPDHSSSCKRKITNINNIKAIGQNIGRYST